MLSGLRGEGNRQKQEIYLLAALMIWTVLISEELDHRLTRINNDMDSSDIQKETEELDHRLTRINTDPERFIRAHPCPSVV